MEKEPRVVITLEAQVTGETDLKTGIAIHGTPSLTDLMAVATTFNAMLACEIEAASKEIGVTLDANAIIRKVADWAPSLTEQYKKQNAEHEADSSEGQTEAKDPEGQA